MHGHPSNTPLTAAVQCGPLLWIGPVGVCQGILRQLWPQDQVRNFLNGAILGGPRLANRTRTSSGAQHQLRGQDPMRGQNRMVGPRKSSKAL